MEKIKNCKLPFSTASLNTCLIVAILKAGLNLRTHIQILRTYINQVYEETYPVSEELFILLYCYATHG